MWYMGQFPSFIVFLVRLVGIRKVVMELLLPEGSDRCSDLQVTADRLGGQCRSSCEKKSFRSGIL